MSTLARNGRKRVLISNISPAIDGGRQPLKRVIQENISLSCNLYADGHDIIRAKALWKAKADKKWHSKDLLPLENERYSCDFHFSKMGDHEYKIQAWLDKGLSWLRKVQLEYEGQQDLELLIQDGIPHLKHLQEAGHIEAKQWLKLAEENYLAAAELLASPQVWEVFYQFPQIEFISESELLNAYCDRRKAAFSATYELFPRSAGAGRHGTFQDVKKRIPRIAELGFDTLLIPPIHPIGQSHRKGKNNSTLAQKGDPGSPWGIGSKDGGHTSIHPELGTLADLEELLKTLDDHHMELAMDLSFHVSPDHPWIKEHPEWFQKRADGSFQFAENPPYKYEDIIPFHFEGEDWKALWEALKEVAIYWIEKGVKMFRVDNAHTKPYYFWEWLIKELRQQYPEVLFLSNAQSNEGFFLELAKLGFAQMGSEFIWKNFRHELIDYTETIFSEPYLDFIRPSFWPNSHDQLPLILQSGNISAYMARLFMAGTLSANYGLYGPLFENMENEALPGTEEYRDSEKYEVKIHQWDTENKLTWLMKIMNAARRDLGPLQQNRNFRILEIENQALFAYIKWDPKDRVVCVVNLDPYNAHEGWLQLPEDLMPLSENGYRMHDYISGADYPWREEWNYVRLDPARPVHLFKVIP